MERWPYMAYLPGSENLELSFYFYLTVQNPSSLESFVLVSSLAFDLYVPLNKEVSVKMFLK